MMIDIINAIWGIDSNTSDLDKFTGYEHLYDKFDTYTKEVYYANPEQTIQEVYDLYRSVNLVPITYFSEEGLRKELKHFKRRGYNHVTENVQGLGNNAGASIGRFLFPNMMTAEPKGRGSNSLRDRFLDERKLKRAIRICFEFRDSNKLVYPMALRTALELVTGENVTNFKAQHARSIVEQLCPAIWGRVYDYSMGYGGRLLGVSSSNMNYTYIGTDPNTETFAYLQYLNELLGSSGVGNELYCETSQDFQPEDIDCAFSSPPYFNLEKYSDEPTQCMVQFSNLDEWFDGYAVQTMQNIYNGLNTGGIFATNIADYKTYGQKEPILVVDRWIETAETLGFKHTNTIKMLLNTRPGVGNERKEGRQKWEGIYVFKK
tara:strand:- start:1851 stop:2975 length:1125 start_codon:yes stop_codon:yes gene_type:complete